VARPRIHREPRVTTAVRLPPALHEQLQQEAAAREVAVNFLIVKAVEDYLERLIPIGELQLRRPDRA
jgi:predicted HicB family RNase H-like nuclease